MPEVLIAAFALGFGISAGKLIVENNVEK